jgi:hypothetical protein
MGLGPAGAIVESICYLETTDYSTHPEFVASSFPNHPCYWMSEFSSHSSSKAERGVMRSAWSIYIP